MAGTFWFMACGYIVYYLLICDNHLHTSIRSIITSSQSLDVKHHLLILGLLPIYIGIMIFGSGLMSLYLAHVYKKYLYPRLKSHKLKFSDFLS